jgi:hypothetical protein
VIGSKVAVDAHCSVLQAVWPTLTELALTAAADAHLGHTPHPKVTLV